MSVFDPSSCYLRYRLQRTTYDDVEEFRLLLLLERLVLRPLRGRLEEAVFIGLREQYPKECRKLILEFQRRGHNRGTWASRGNRGSVLEALVESRRIEHRERCWLERAEWIRAGGMP